MGFDGNNISDHFAILVEKEGGQSGAIQLVHDIGELLEVGPVELDIRVSLAELGNRTDYDLREIALIGEAQKWFIRDRFVGSTWSIIYSI